ncbi:MAG: tRNA (adenosine(37)-N6)-dimethylallyltransferase MiaA [Roseobacter sp.]
MMTSPHLTPNNILDTLDPDKPVLIAGPTASGKSALALRIAAEQGGRIINADASQVYDCWRVLTARPSAEEEALAPHALYGHVAARSTYSVGHWLRDLAPLLNDGPRPIIVGGTGLYFMGLTQGLADIPAVAAEIRSTADSMSREDMLNGLDPETLTAIDKLNRARVQRAWEVLTATGRGLASWQADTPAPMLPMSEAQGIVFDMPKDWLNDRIALRFDQMIEGGALDEARAVLPAYDPSLPAHRAIGAAELMQYLKGEISLDAAREAANISTRQFAKRQRTWFRSKMGNWLRYSQTG